MLDRLQQIWCLWMHDAAMWPMHGKYECRTCGRVHAVEWAGEEVRQSAQRRSGLWRLARASK